MLITVANTASQARETVARGPDGMSAPSAESRRLRDDVAAARHTAMSALNNDRFRVMLEQITGPGASDALVTMQAGATPASTDFNSALLRYAENSG